MARDGAGVTALSPATAPAGRPVVEAAGCVVVRPGPHGPQVLLVHRPATTNHGTDWSWPKGKLDDGETHPAAAVRETAEEAGLRVVLDRPLPELRYEVPPGRLKRVRCWLAHPAPGEEASAASPEEVDAVEWLDAGAARERLTYAHDAHVLDAALAAAAEPTRPVVLLRHARAVARRDWTGPEDGPRPLTDRGHAQAHALTSLLGAWDVRWAVTSPWARCVQTVLPSADAHGWDVAEEEDLTERAFREDPARALAVLDRALDGDLDGELGEDDVDAAGRPGVLLCTHGPALPSLQERLADRLAVSATAEGSARRSARALALPKLGKGELLVAHVAGRGPGARAVALERHRV